MAKITNYLLVMSGIMALMYYSGLITGTDTLLTLLLNPAKISYSGFFAENILVAIEGLAAVGVLIGFAISGKPDLAVAAPVAILLADLGFNFIRVYTKIVSINANYTPFATLLFAPLMFLFAISVFEWWRGITT